MDKEYFKIQKNILHTTPPNKENKKKEIKKKNEEQDKLVELTIETERPKIIALDIIVGIAIFYIIVAYFILPFGFGYYRNEVSSFFQVLGNHYKSITRYYNLPIFFLFIGIVVCCFSFNNNDFKKAGLVLIIAYITSLAVEAKLFVTGALISGIATYIYIRVLVSQEKKKN